MFRNLFFIACLALVSGCSVSSKQLELVDHQAPNAIYYPLDSEPRALSSEKGKTVVLAFWDSGCHHCRRELPILDQIAWTYSNNQNIKFIAISVNSASEDSYLKKAIKELDLKSLEHAFSGNDIYDPAFMSFRGEAIPYFVIVDKRGIVRWLGHDAAELEEKIKEVI